MSEETKPETATSTTTPPKTEDQITNLKGEFNRKITETNKLVEQMAATNQQLNQKLDQILNPKKTSKEEPLEQMMYTDPKRYTQTVKEQAKQEAMEAMGSANAVQTAVNQRIAALAADYPELADANSELTKASIEILAGASNLQKQDPTTYEYAVLKAAQKLEVKPKSQRPKTDEDFLPTTHSSPQSRTRRKSEESVINENRDAVKAFGINLDDPKTKDKYLKILKSKGLA